MSAESNDDRRTGASPSRSDVPACERLDILATGPHLAARGASRPCPNQVRSLPISSFADKTFTDPSKIRNFCIIAHIDHGKSTLADRMLQLTGVVEERQMRAQYLDRMDIERERGITIKAQNVRLPWKVGGADGDGDEFVMHLIDTPGHVDFTYEVSRALEACEGAVLLVDAAQGIEAQTLANLYLALDKDLTIIPVLNKIDLPAADPDRYAAEIAHIIGCEPEDVLRVSGKTGEGVQELLDEVVRQVPPPVGDADAPARAMIFDSVYDTYRGVVTYVRVVDGRIMPREKIKMMSTGTTHELLEVGIVSPEPKASQGLGVGEVGYLITGVKDVRQSKVGDTVTTARGGADEPLTGYREPRPMVYSGLYPVDGSDYPDLREALDKLQLNDAALTYEPETSVALGFGFRCGFLGLLHMEITRERLQREFGLDLISTSPNVVYRVIEEGGAERQVTNPSDWPEGKSREIYEPIVKVTIIAPSEFIGAIMELCQSRRGELGGMDYLSETRVELRYTLPLAEIIFDFFDSLKSRTRGYASLDYEEAGEQLADLVKVDILLQGEPVDAFSAIVHKDAASAYGNKMTTKLKELIPRQQFEVPVQAAIGSKIIARENIRAIRKDVLAKCYGGDISRKRKLLEKQKEGKKRMKTIGRVDVPQEAFVAALSSDAGGDKPKK
ncbi:translation elongation factor 4 [Rhodococcus sp. HNM0569]|uniref:translation elongation factor 4 n=1 Tax=Rhodococcus sp. HNM0569 TaxID=2716340 RepID=UPI001F0F78FC|nr:translation elongation factor 4 [Rhodococcus sp. HNM0569]